MTATRLQTVFASLDPPQAWPPTRGRPQPQRLELALDALPGVGVTLKRKLAKLGLETVRDLLEHRPHRYETAADEVAIAALGGSTDEVVDRRRGPERHEAAASRTAHARHRARIATARRPSPRAGSTSRGSQISSQPGVHVRLRGKPGRYGFDVKSYDVGEGEATKDFAPVYPASEEITPKRLRTLVAHALGHVVDYPDPLPAELRDRESMPLKRDALFVIHHPESEHEAETGQTAARVRGASAAPARHRAARGGTRAHARAVARRARRADRALPHVAAVLAHAVPGAGGARDRRRPRAHDSDAASAAGRRRLRQDGRRALRAAARGRARTAGRADGADGDARRAALPHDRRHLRGARRHVRAPDERVAEEGARRGARRGRRRRHARADSGGRRAARPRGRGRRRAAPLRRRAAQGVDARSRAARAAHDRDADPAHARAHRLRRSRRLRDREAARGAQADHHELDRGAAGLRGVHPPHAAAPRGPAGLRRLPARRGVGDDARARRRGRGGAAPARRAPRVPGRLHARPDEAGRAPRRDGRASTRASSTSSSRRP